MESEYEIHPAADIFPMMTEEEYRGLVEDMREHGQREWAALLGDKLVDGRNRQRACKELGIELECCELEPDTDPVAYVLSKNLHRRHLTASQRSQCAQDVAKMREGRPSKETLQSCNVSLEDAAKLFGVSKRSVSTARHVAEAGDKSVVNAVKSGVITVATAAKLVDAVADKREQRAIVKEGPEAIKEAIKPGPDDKPKKPPKRKSKNTADPSSHPAAAPESAQAPADADRGVVPSDSGFEAFYRDLTEWCASEIKRVGRPLVASWLLGASERMMRE